MLLWNAAWCFLHHKHFWWRGQAHSWYWGMTRNKSNSRVSSQVIPVLLVLAFSGWGSLNTDFWVVCGDQGTHPCRFPAAAQVRDIGAQTPFSPTQKVPETVTSQSKVWAKHHLLTQQSNPLAVCRAKSATSQPESCYFITCCTFQSDRDTLDQPGGDYLVKEISEIQGEIDWKHYSVGAGQFYPTKFLLSLVACAYYTWYYWNIDQKLPITFHWVVNKVCWFFFLWIFHPK